MRAFLLARVSTREQEDNNSIPAQIRRLQDYANYKSLEIAETFRLVESSTKANRKKLQLIIEKIRVGDEPMALVAETVDRLQRDYKESVMLDELRKQGLVELHFVRENLIIHKDSNSSEIMRWDMAVMFAKNYVAQLSDNVKRSQEQKLRNGEWLGKAPFGYVNSTKPDGSRWIEVNPADARLVKEIYSSYATGTTSLLELKKKIKAEYGIRIATSQLDRILHRQFYYGEMLVNKKIYKHSYEAIISRKLYDQVEAVRTGYKSKKHRWGGLPYTYRGLISCADCSCRITFEKKKGKYIYGHCTQYRGRHGAAYVTEVALSDQLMGMLRTIQIPTKAYTAVSKALKARMVRAGRDSDKQLEALRKALSGLEGKKEKVYDHLLEGIIEQKTYLKKREEINSQILQNQKRQKAFELLPKDQFASISHLLKLSVNAPILFEKANIDQKRRMLKLVLSNLELDGKQLRWELKKPFDKMAFCKENSTWLGWRDSNPRS